MKNMIVEHTRDTKVICTLGPASSKESMIEKMASRGMNVVRVNFSHGTHEGNGKLISLVKKVNQRGGYDVKILQDLEGYRIRVGNFIRNIVLEKDKIVTMAPEKNSGVDEIPIDYDGDISKIEKGFNVFIDDGKLYLKVISNSGKKIKLKVFSGGVLKERKGINIPKLKLASNILTKKDKKDLEFGIKVGVDYVAQSFVRNRKDVQRVIDLVKPHLPNCKIISKIESQEGVKNINSILDVTDGVMVARGDLGVSLPIYKIPIVQKYLIRRSKRRGKFAITATQMLDSMIENGRPTRAEVSDVANAILDGTDYVMLSGETAVGKFPSRTVKMMNQIIEYTENYEIFKL